ncbi:ATP-binding protein [Peristeroidobacter soli]|uniref:ATP-binding protein n=1 Tax=Peristeroidobacter soli TaxID=2497877 RepID=UPI00101DE391|nr:ATP-binding protein [Peristeroidobacter soli]
MAVVLVVDDDRSARELMKTVLGYAGHQVHEAHDGAEALLLVHQSMPALVIVDLLMPKMDGMEFVRRLRRHSATAAIPVVFYTASYLESQAQHLARLCGVTHFISKPAEPEQIFSVVNAALGERDVLPQRPASSADQQDYLAGLTAALSRKAAHVIPRLEALIALGLRLASEKDPHRLLLGFCEAARKIVGAKISIVAIRHDGDSTQRFTFTSGLAPTLEQQLSPGFWDSEVHRQVRASRQPRRLDSLPPELPLPAGLGPLHCLLCAPILSPQRAYGWLTLLESTNHVAFDAEDEVLAHILAAQVGRIYENGSLYAEIKRYAERLEVEVAQRKQSQDEIERLNRDLECRIQQRTAELVDLNKELEAFGYTVSHELRAPLRAVVGYSTMALNSEGERLSDESRRCLKSVVESGLRMNRMVDDLLQFSRKGRQALHIVEVDMHSLVREIWDELIHETNAATRLELARIDRAPADRAMIREVWMNLLSNAVKYSRNAAQPQVAVSSEAIGGMTRYCVSDNGAGFSAEHASRLFRVFERLHTHSEFEGTGVGLAIVERIVGRHGGRVWAESQPGQGARFTFTLPHRQSEPCS